MRRPLRATCSQAALPPSAAMRCIARGATVALYEELALYPKPGLVSLVDAGSHHDMHAATFMRSLFALRHYFAASVAAGAGRASFVELQRLGIEAERVMLQATAGVNTHRGAIFTLGLLCAAAGGVLGSQAWPAPERVREHLVRAWGPALHRHAAQARMSHGQRAAREHGLRSAGEEAALGFPVLFEVTLPALQGALASGLDARLSRLQALMQTMAVLDDTNLAHRGGLSGLRWAQRQAQAFVQAGGAAQRDGLVQAGELHAEFVSRRLSPGGSADLLAAACWLHRLRPTGVPA